ncbi:hypothetical protein ACLE20_13295 [Rhizobium sp. YIM 134829]|uniref:hypothetical protein n=1 Tax=Rhizobium sp. YIM 134829 TaxID=3390453 RepID=UPI00397A7FA7
MQCNFQVGQKVVCISADWFGLDDAPYSGPDPVEGRIYVVSHIQVDDAGCWLQLEGFPQNAGWEHDAFRPLVTRETDISVFTKLLQPSKQTELA